MGVLFNHKQQGEKAVTPGLERKINEGFLMMLGLSILVSGLSLLTKSGLMMNFIYILAFSVVGAKRIFKDLDMNFTATVAANLFIGMVGQMLGVMLFVGLAFVK